jgi:predicted dehydrogenase
VHCIDTLRFVLQDEAVRVSARAVVDPPPSTVESSVALTLEFARGTMANVFVSFAAEYRTPLEVVGETGVLRAQDALTVDHPVVIESNHIADAGTQIVSNHLAYVRQVDAFADTVEGNSKFPCSGEDGWQNQEILDAALRSMASGRAEEVPRIL